jgi:predicted metal-dependent peptidase
MSEDIEQKLSKARTRLILDHPFIGSLALHLEMKPTDAAWCPKTTTNAKAIFYNEDYIDSLKLDETIYVLAQQALHCGLSHFARRGKRDKQRGDVACDYAVNAILDDEDMQGPPGTLLEKSYKGMTAEEIYPYIENFDDQDRQEQEPLDGDSGQGEQQDQQKNNVSSEELKQLDKQWQMRLANALQQAAQAGKLKGELKRMVKSLLEAQMPWRNLLAHYVNQSAREDYRYHRPSSRRGGEAIYPSLRSDYVDVIVVLDTSGSISEGELNSFVAELDSIKGQARARITLFACDTEIDPATPITFEPWDTFEMPKDIKGGGGTEFKPVFEYIEREYMRPDLLIYFTDAKASFPAQEPNYPVIWLVKGKEEVPWGQRIQLN